MTTSHKKQKISHPRPKPRLDVDFIRENKIPVVADTLPPSIHSYEKTAEFAWDDEPGLAGDSWSPGGVANMPPGSVYINSRLPPPVPYIPPEPSTVGGTSTDQAYSSDAPTSNRRWHRRFQSDGNNLEWGDPL